MSRLAHAAAFQAAAPSSSDPGFLARLRRHLARLEAAMAGQVRLSAIPPETPGDTGLSAEDLTGVPSHDPALPFFLQSGFGRHDR